MGRNKRLAYNKMRMLPAVPFLPSINQVTTMTHPTLLLADDDEMIVDALKYQFEYEGFAVLTAYDGAAALTLARSAAPDLVLLDVMMPHMQGWEVCRTLRAESNVPIILLTARGAELDRVLGLELGADDYVVKPFSFRELLARVRSNLRRVNLTSTPQLQNGQTLHLGALTIDRKRHQISRQGAEVSLSQKEYDLLMALLDAQGGVVKRGDLLDQVWGVDWIGDTRTLDVHIRWLRAKLEEEPGVPQLILTVRGVGYRLVTPNELEA